MNFLTSDIKKLYVSYLFASMGSALVMSIYSFVDTIAVGQSVGPMGTAAMAAINPLYSVLAFLSILCGIGGSVLMGNAKGRGQEEKGNAYFTSSLLLIGSILLIGWSCFLLFQEQILTFFGATPDTMPYVLEYAKWIIRAFPFFIAGGAYFHCHHRAGGPPEYGRPSCCFPAADQTCFSAFRRWAIGKYSRSMG